jgi:hypothetical protein
MQSDGDGGAWVPGEVWVPDGLRMAEAKDTPGVQRALLFGEEQGTSGPPLFRATDANEEIDGNESSEIDPRVILLAAAALAAAVVTTIVIIKHGPKLVTWWKEVAFPTVSVRVLRLLRIQPRAPVDADTATAAIGPVPAAEFSKEVGVVIDDLREDMSSDEAKKRLLLVMMAASIISEQVRKLSTARIKDQDIEALQESMTKLTTGEVVDDLNRILGSERAVIDEATQALFVEVFGGGRFVQGKYQPLTLDGVRGALKLPGEDGNDYGPAVALSA